MDHPQKFIKQKIGFIGGGQMALALVNGFLTSELISPNQIMASAPSNKNLKVWENLSASTTHDNAKVIKNSDVIFLAVKPHIFPEVLKKLKESLSSENMLTNESKLFISIMAGIKVETLTTSLKSIVQSPRIIRATVNTPARVSQGCFVYSLSKE